LSVVYKSESNGVMESLDVSGTMVVAINFL